MLTPRAPMSVRALTAVAVTSFLLAACGGDADPVASGGESDRLVVAVSLAPYADLVERVGGDRVEVRLLVPQGVDGHTYEPTPDDARNIAGAELVVLPGRDLNQKVTELVQTNIGDVEVVDLNERTVPEDKAIYTDTHSHGDGPAHGHDMNPHTWTNVPFVIDKVAVIADELSAADPDGAATYTANRDALQGELRSLDMATVAALSTIPLEDRTLVVYHDSWSYFGENYGFDVVGALQAVDFSEPSAGEMRNMTEQIRDADVPGFFGSTVFPTEVLEQVAEESGVDYVGNLSDDALPGEPGDPEHSYTGMMVQNIRTIVEGLGGNTSPLDQVQLS